MSERIEAHQPASGRGISRRELIRFSGAALLLLVSPLARSAALSSLLAVRVWPADEYTRVTLEARHALAFKYFTLDNPRRLVVDLTGIGLDSVLRTLPDKVLDTDPYIALIRAGQNTPDVVRIVLELKADIEPQIFTLDPVGDYGHRLVLDLYPTVPHDPLAALIEQSGNNAGESEPTQVARAHPSPMGRDATPHRTRPFTVMLDPGHGGEDPGAIGRRGSYEKNVTLAVARKLKAIIDAEPGMRALLTRDGDYFVPLNTRVARARRAKADLFVSIHADAFKRPEANGSSVFVLSERGATSSAASWLARKENDADLVGGVNLARQESHLARTLLDLSQAATIHDSLKLGQSVLSELGDINTLHKTRVEQANFAVLRAPDVPSILIETAFISNPAEERKLNDRGYQQKMATAILRGIRSYHASITPPATTQVARLSG